MQRMNSVATESLSEKFGVEITLREASVKIRQSGLKRSRGCTKICNRAMPGYLGRRQVPMIQSVYRFASAGHAISNSYILSTVVFGLHFGAVNPSASSVSAVLVTIPLSSKKRRKPALLVMCSR